MAACRLLDVNGTYFRTAVRTAVTLVHIRRRCVCDVSLLHVYSSSVRALALEKCRLTMYILLYEYD